MPVNALPVYQNPLIGQEYFGPDGLYHRTCLQAAHNPTCSTDALPVGESAARRDAGTSRPTSAADLLREGHVDMLRRYNWNLFGSMTFRGDSVHPERADKTFRYYMSILNRRLYGPRWHKQGKGIAWARAIEMQRRDVIHFHCLLSSPLLKDMHRAGWYRQPDGRWSNGLNELWNEMAGFARIEPVDAQEAVSRYVSKYVVKGGDLDYGGPLGQPWTLAGYQAEHIEGANASL